MPELKVSHYQLGNRFKIKFSRPVRIAGFTSAEMVALKDNLSEFINSDNQAEEDVIEATREQDTAIEYSLSLSTDNLTVFEFDNEISYLELDKESALELKNRLTEISAEIKKRIGDAI